MYRDSIISTPGFKGKKKMIHGTVWPKKVQQGNIQEHLDRTVRGTEQNTGHS